MDFETREEFERFLEMQENERTEYLKKFKLSWWERFKLKMLNKWWTSMRKQNPNLNTFDLWESIYKGRF